jgi:hypothetical protein
MYIMDKNLDSGDVELFNDMKSLLKSRSGDMAIGDHGVVSAVSTLEDVFQCFRMANSHMHREEVLGWIKRGMKELVEHIGEFFGGQRVASGRKVQSLEYTFFVDTFKGLLNTGKLIGRGMIETDEAFSQEIVYNGKKTNLAEILKNINNSQYLVHNINYNREHTETDFSGMNMREIADELVDIFADALPPQFDYKDVGHRLAERVLSQAKFAGILENTIEQQEKVNK